MANVYAVICHRLTNPLLFTVEQLAKNLENIILVHIDKKTHEYEYSKILNRLSEFSNVKFTVNRVKVYWGDESQIHAILTLMREAECYDYEYFSLISGDDVPTTDCELRDFILQEAYLKKTEFIGYNLDNNARDRVAYNYPSFFYQKSNSLFIKLKKFFFKIVFLRFYRKENSLDTVLFKGSIWFTLTKNLINYITFHVEENEDYLGKFNNSFCADEVFFHTIVFNSPFRNNVYGVYNNFEDCRMGLRYIDWINGPEFPKILNDDDLKSGKTKNTLFARKFSSDVSPEKLVSLVKHCNK